VAKFAAEPIPVRGAAVRTQLREAAQRSGVEYEGTLGGWIAKRKVPVLERIEDRTGIPVGMTSLDKTRGPKSSGSIAVFQWHRGHRYEGALRIPEGTVEIVGPKRVVTHAFIMEVSLQADMTQIGNSLNCRLKMEKVDQLVWTTSLLAGKYREGLVEYLYLCPRPPAPETVERLLMPLEKLSGTDNVSFTWAIVDHSQSSDEPKRS
jgi:hypothetical protein